MWGQQGTTFCQQFDPFIPMLLMKQDFGATTRVKAKNTAAIHQWGWHIQLMDYIVQCSIHADRRCALAFVTNLLPVCVSQFKHIAAHNSFEAGNVGFCLEPHCRFVGLEEGGNFFKGFKYEEPCFGWEWWQAA
jgi:hypothetical protein